VFEGLNRILTRHTWKVIEELVNGLTSFEIVQQIVKWNTCAAKDRGTPEYLRVSRYQLF